MRISDWSSDVCTSDLAQERCWKRAVDGHGLAGAAAHGEGTVPDREIDGLAREGRHLRPDHGGAAARPCGEQRSERSYAAQDGAASQQGAAGELGRAHLRNSTLPPMPASSYQGT